MSINLPTLILIMTSFIVFMVMMKKSFFDPIRGIKQEREKKLLDERQSAQTILKEQQTLESNYETGIRDARKKSQEIIQEFRTEAKAKADAKLNESRQQAQSHLEKGMDELSSWRNETYSQLEHERQELAKHIIQRLFPSLEKSPTH